MVIPLLFPKRFLSPLILLLLFYWSCSDRNDGSSGNAVSSSLQISTLDHKSFSFDEIKNNQATVFLFLQPECPFCNSYGKTFHDIDSVYHSKHVTFYGVVSGKNYPNSEIDSFRLRNRLAFQMLLDPDFKLQKHLGARVTPEAFLLDSKGNTIYRGLVDDWAYEIGKVRAQAHNHYLTDAMDEFLSNSPVTIDSTRAVGCYIQ